MILGRRLKFSAGRRQSSNEYVFFWQFTKSANWVWTMGLQLTPELQHALHASQSELEVVDPSTNRHYVIVAKDRWLERTAVNQAAAGDHGHRGRDSDSVDLWTEDKSRRRAELVDRQIAGTLTGDEEAELQLLQQQMRAYRDKVAPLPLEDTRRLHAQLMEKARQAQARKA